MSKIEGICREVIEKSEWVAIATAGPDGPHLAANWGHYLRSLGVDGDEFVFPAGRYVQTEQNLKRNNRVELLFASQAVARPNGQGQGCCVSGTAEIQTTGPAADAAKAKFPWARGALVVKIESAKTQL